MSKQLASLLQKAGFLKAEEIAAAQQRADQGKKSLRETILNEGHISEEQLAQLFSAQLRIPYMRLAAAFVDPDAVKVVPEEQAKRHLCLAIKKEEAEGGGSKRPTLVLAMADPTDLAAVQEMEFATGCTVKVVVTTQTEILDGIASHYAPEDWLENFLRNVDEGETVELMSVDEEGGASSVEALAESGSAPAVKMVNLLIQRAIKDGASDIHLEPGLNHVQVRYRVQGLLREFTQVPKWIQEPLVSRIKILSKLDITERRIPQDGRIRVGYEKRDVDLRISTLPTHFGEKVVMRILGGGQVPPTASLGFTATDLEAVRNAANQPQGLMLVTGPTGSGKTTTLYAILNEKKSPDINIITVEDPIEFQVPGLNQVQVNTKAGLTFASSLRSILRQDPDVILVGEIRDLETAEIAFHAAMTGHMVLSTLHTNSTVATIDRLLDLGVDPHLVTASLSLVVAQRLLRKLCSKCKTRQQPPAKQLERLRLKGTEHEFFQPVGCDACAKTGYAGRIGVYELLRLTPAVKELIGRKAPQKELYEATLRAGTVPLLQGAMELVRDGITSVDEVLRVIQLQEEEVARCPKCSTLIDRQFSFCPYCKHALKAVCASCQQELKANWKSCPYCNTEVQRSESAVQTPDTAPPEEPAPGPRVSETPPEQAAETVRTPRILVVDDDEVMRTVIVNALEMLPHKPRIREAENGAEALKAVAAEVPDLIVLDVMMPGMNGFEVCKKLRSDLVTAFVPVMMLTASTSEENRSKGFLVGTDDFMAKPVSVPELHSRVTRLLRRTYGL